MAEWPDIPFEESMPDDPNGVLILCKSVDDADALEDVLRDHGISDLSGDLVSRYNRCKQDYPDEDVCFNVLDVRLLERRHAWDESVGYCNCSYYEEDEEGEFGNYVKCVFRCANPGTEISDTEFASALLGGERYVG